jgi:HTH DNA binding domain
LLRKLRITPHAAQNLVAELGLREATGRGRYRAWGIISSEVWPERFTLSGTTNMQWIRPIFR